MGEIAQAIQYSQRIENFLSQVSALFFFKNDTWRKSLQQLVIKCASNDYKTKTSHELLESYVIEACRNMKLEDLTIDLSLYHITTS